jgi:alpha-mannosidase
VAAARVSLAALCLAGVALAQVTKAPDIASTPTLYVVDYAHLDTQWRWNFPQTISEYLLKTMRVNFDFMDEYPHYVFNWTGANRYRLMKEYYPADYARMQQYAARGQWFPAGSSVEEGDVNLPSAEGLFRQFLYGNEYFRKDFGKASTEYMLPDCFGFPASLPSILAHAGIKGFSTQKLNSVGNLPRLWEVLIHPSRLPWVSPSMLASGSVPTAITLSPHSIPEATPVRSTAISANRRRNLRRTRKRR